VAFTNETHAWNSAKNDVLKRELGVSFEEVVFHIAAGDEAPLCGSKVTCTSWRSLNPSSQRANARSAHDDVFSPLQ
jgi:hypothetical protein